ncbi:MAG: ABC transporter permease [Lachnospiraceae bacterium]|nr:ABC transporter permease [Lachnospiraceae bacterium]
MQTIKTIFFKELKRILSDKRMILSLYILPLFMWAIIFTASVFFLSVNEKDQKAHKAVVTIYNAPESFKHFLEEKVASDNEEKTNLTNTELDYKIGNEITEAEDQSIKDKQLDLVVVFEEEFDSKVALSYSEGEIISDIIDIPGIKLYYNPSSDYSSNAYTNLAGIIDDYRKECQKERFGSVDVARVFSVESETIKDENKANGEMLGMALPYMITILLFAGVMSLGIDMIAGEKERGTLAPLLLAPINRTHIIIAKMAALLVLSFLSAMVYILSILLALPVIIGIYLNNPDLVDSAKTTNEISVSGSIHFEGWQVLSVALIIIVMLLLYVALVNLIAVFSKNVREGSNYVTPLYMLVMISGMSTIYGSPNVNEVIYFIPFYGGLIAMKNILGQNISTFSIVASIGVHLILGISAIIIAARAFSSPKVLDKI